MTRNKPVYRNILFDLDGTLTDSALGVTRSIRYALKKYGIEANPADLTAMIGPPLQEAFQKIYGFSRDQAYQAVEYYREYFREKGIFENQLYQGIPELLSQLQSDQRRIFLATSKPTIFAEKVLDHFSIAKYFTLVIGSNLDGSRVAKTEVIEAVCKLSGGLDRKETVMVGDREQDVIGAQAHQIDTIAVAYGYGSIQELKAVKPMAIAGTVAELRNLLLA